MPSVTSALATYSTVIVTGGSSGIGKSFIELGAKLNPRLQFCNLSRRSPEINISGLRLNHFSCDLSRAADLERGVEELTEFLAQAVPAGRVLLINNSGFGTYGHFPEPNLPEQLEMLDLNVRGLVDVAGRLLPLLKRHGGMIVNIASTAAFQPTPYMATYGASKAFVLHWSLALNEELRGSGVSALAVCPGPTSTQFFRRAGLQQGSVADSLSMTVEDVVMDCYRAIAAERSQLVTGWKNKVSTFVAGKTPKPLAARVARIVLGKFRLRQVKR